MAAIIITPSDVLPAAEVQYLRDPASQDNYLAGENINAGQYVRYDEAAERLFLAENDGVEENAQAGGIALATVVTGQPLPVVRSGKVTVGTVLTKGQYYFIHQTAGSIGPESDIVATNWVTKAGYAYDSQTLQVSIEITGVTK